ncbi:MAG: peptide synthetase [Lachnospiraceae bacterium]|nr:peptide synthetase [Lachnospiraceae bacterium]
MKSEKIERYPLTAAQKIHFYTLKYCPKKQVLNIGTSITVEGELDFGVLKQAIYQAYERQEAMRIRFTDEIDGQVYQYIAPKEEREIEEMDFRGKTMEEAEDALRKMTEIPFARVDSPMNKIMMIKMPDGYQGIYLNVDHMTMDSYSIITLFTDILMIYVSLKYGLEYPAPMRSYVEALKHDLAYEGSEEEKRDQKFWQENYQKDEPIFTYYSEKKVLEEQRAASKNPNQRAARIACSSVEACHTIYHLEPEPTARILRYISERQLPFQSLLMMGIRTYLSKVNGGQKDVSIKTTVSRRATVLDKKSGGTRIHFFPMRTILEEDITFLEGMKKIQETENEIFRHANYDPVRLLKECQEAYHAPVGTTYECMSVTYQPLTLRNANDNLYGIHFKSKWYSNGVAGCPLYLTVMHNSQDGGMDFYFEHQPGAVEEKELELMYYYLCRIIFMGMENDSMTIGEILRTV